MPELPEVETVARGLMALHGFHLKTFIFHRNSLREPIPTQIIQARFNHQYLQQVTRRAKYLLWHIHSPHTTLGGLICHLGMSGRFGLIQIKDDLPALPEHTHWHVTLEDPHNHTQWLCYYTDPRRFGRLSLWDPHTSPSEHPFLRSLGPEPLELTPHALAQHLHRRSRASAKVSIKALLLQQTTLAGIGNIYASEALFQAQILPERPACTLTETECRQLAQGIRTTLEHAISLGGTTLKNFKYLDGHEGLFALECQVYNRQAHACGRCGDTIVKIIQQGRGTFFCPGCQF